MVGVHAKDGKCPTEAGKLGSEHPLGQGDVGIDCFTGKLKEIGYRGPVTIERKIPDSEQKVKDLLWAKGFLDRLIEMGE